MSDPKSNLDEAWAEAEAALPAGWRIADLSLLLSGDEPTWTAEANRVVDGRWTGDDFVGQGDTPGDALRDLADKARKRERWTDAEHAT